MDTSDFLLLFSPLDSFHLYLIFIYIWMQNALLFCMNCRLHSSLLKFTVHQMSYFTMPGKLYIFFTFAKSTPFFYVKFFNIVILSSVRLKFFYYSIFLLLLLVYLKTLFFTQWRDVISEKGLFSVIVVYLHKWIETQLMAIWSLIFLSWNLLYL